MTIDKRGGLNSVSFDWSRFKLFTLKFSKESVQTPSCERPKNSQRTLCLSFEINNCFPITPWCRNAKNFSHHSLNWNNGNVCTSSPIFEKTVRIGSPFSNKAITPTDIKDLVARSHSLLVFSIIYCTSAHSYTFIIHNIRWVPLEFLHRCRAEIRTRGRVPAAQHVTNWAMPHPTEPCRTLTGQWPCHTLTEPCRTLLSHAASYWAMPHPRYLECRKSINSDVWIYHVAYKFPRFFHKPPTLYR